MFSFKNYVKNPCLGELLDEYYQKYLSYFKKGKDGFIYQPPKQTTIYSLESLVEPLHRNMVGLSDYQLEFLEQALLIEEKLTPFWTLYEDVSFRNGRLYLFKTCAADSQRFHQLSFSLLDETPDYTYTYHERLRTFNALELKQESWGNLDELIVFNRWKQKLEESNLRKEAKQFYHQCQQEWFLESFISSPNGRFQRVSSEEGVYQLPLYRTPFQTQPERLEAVMDVLMEFPHINQVEEKIGHLWIYFDTQFEQDMPRDLRIQQANIWETNLSPLIHFLADIEI